MTKHKMALAWRMDSHEVWPKEMTPRQAYEMRVNRTISKVQQSRVPLRVKCLVCNIIKLKLAFVYGQQKPHERRQHIRNMQRTLLEELGR